MLQFQVLKISEITPDPNQPRKYYDEQSMTDLTNSIIESGVLQPVLVRYNPHAEGYLLVCGERRFRASIAAGLEDIPAIVRNLSDDEALQLQIVENLQRKDVHPMEEAVAFKSFMESKNWTFDEISKRVGKSEYYVKQRIKLNQIIEPMQQLFFQNKMSIKTALQIAATETGLQEQIYNDFVDDDDLKNDRFVLEINTWTWSKYHALLGKATFDLSDETLNTSMGACITCQFNSSVSKLFPDELESVKCSNIRCFSLKTQKSFELKLEVAKEDPSVVLITTEHNPDKETKKLMSQIEGILERKDYELISEPEKPEWEDYEGNNDSREEDKAEYEDAIEYYQEEFAEWKEKVDSGAFIKAFVVGGYDKGKYAYIKLNRKSKNSAPSAEAADIKSAVSTEIALAEVDSEILRIKEKENRSKELDQNKIWEEVKSHFNPSANASVLKDELNPLERRAIAMAMFKNLNWSEKRAFEKLFKWEESNSIEVDSTTFNQMCRFFMLDQLPPTTLTNGYTDHAKLSLEIAREYFPGLLMQIEDEVNLKAEKRITKVEQRLKELQDQKKKLKAKK